MMAVLVNLVTQLAYNSYGLVLPSMRDNLRLSHTQEGSLIAALSVLGIAAALVFGILASRYGSRLIIGVSAIGVGLSMGLLGMSSSFISVLVMSAAMGFATGGCTTPMMGMLSVWFTSHNRGTAAGIAAAGGGISFIIIGALVPWLTDRDPEDGWRHVWYFLAATVLTIGVICLLFLRDRPEGQRTPGVWPMAAYKSSPIWVMTFLAFCSGWCTGLYTTFFGEYLEQEHVDLAVSGRLWALLGFVAIGSSVFWGNLSDRLGRRAGFVLSFIILVVACLLFWAIPVLAGFIASVVLMGVTFRAAYTICAAAAGDYVRTQVSTAAFGLMGVGAGVGLSTGPPIGGWLADATGDLGLVFVLAAGVAALGVSTSMLLRRPSATR